MNNHLPPVFANILNNFAHASSAFAEPTQEQWLAADRENNRLKQSGELERRRQDEAEKRERHMRGCSGEQPW